MTTPDRIADRIKSVLEARQRSISWLSAETGIADKTLRRRFVKPAQLDLEQLSEICIALDVALEDVLNLDIDVRTLTARVPA